MFNLILTNGTEDLVIPFRIRDTKIAKKWFNELSKNYSLYETERFTNWGTGNVIEKLNKCIDLINNYDNIIDRYINKDSKNIQQDLNYLHKFFEDLRGDVNIETDWFRKSPEYIKKAVEEFNILIHQLEAELRTSNHPTVVVTFENRPKFNLEKDDLKHFTFKWKSGTVYINYCQVGKTVLDVFKDKDHIAEGIRPQEYYSADFMVKFGPSTLYYLYILKKIYLKSWLKKQTFKFENPNLGMIPVADLSKNIDREYLKKFNKVKGIECLK